MELVAGQVAVVTGGASGIGLALAERFARSGLNIVLADVDEPGLKTASDVVGALGVEVLVVPTDVSDEGAVQALASAALERFGAVHIVCNNAGVSSRADPWFGPLSAWTWVLGVNLWGVVHGIRAFLPVLAGGGGGHIVNTASIAGLLPGFGPSYDASKHAVVAVSEDLYRMVNQAGLPIGVSVLCPGWVRTGIIDAERNWPGHLGEVPPAALGSEVVTPLVRRAIAEGTPPAAVADLVAEAVEAGRFWVFPNPEWVDLAVRRWHGIGEGALPELEVDVPGLPPAAEIAARFEQLLTPPTS
jgi:NAD(P)-dependent dehydrogenase (short-subunit alcohol dehydrogenase family)